MNWKDLKIGRHILSGFLGAVIGFGVSLFVFKEFPYQQQDVFFINQPYVLLRIYPDAGIVCQKFPEGWYCNGFDYINKALLQVVNFQRTIIDKVPAILNMLGLNREINRIIGRKYLNEKEKEAPILPSEETDSTTNEDNER